MMVIAFITVAALTFGASTAAADASIADDLTVEHISNGEAPPMQTDGENATCEGAPRMSQTSIVSPQDRITADQPGVVEANFRVDPSAPEDCTVVVDLEFSFSESGYQFGGGAEWDQATTNLVATTFDDLNSGEIRDIRGELHTNGAEPGDEVTVIADYEIWYEGDRENSVQQSGIRHTIEVEEVNEPDEPIVDDDGADDADEPINDNNELLQFVEDNLGLLALFFIGTIAVIGLATRKPFVQLITGGGD